MSEITIPVSRDEAIAEIKRRKEPRGSVKRKTYGRPEVGRLSGAELTAIAPGYVVGKPVAKVKPAPVQVAAVAPVVAPQVPAVVLPEGKLIMAIDPATGAQVQVLVPKAAPKAPKAERTEIQKLHTNLRAQAQAWKVAEYHRTGKNVTWATAYEKFATAAASVTNAPGFTGV